MDIDADVNMNFLDLDLELDLNVNVISPMWPENDFNLTDDLSFVTSTSDFVWDIPIEGFEDFTNHSSNVPMTCKIQIAENVLDAAPESEAEPATNTFDSLFELEVFNECLKDIDNPIELVPYTSAPMNEEEIITTEWNRNRRRSLLYDKNEFVQSEERQRYQERRVKATSSSTSIIQSTNRIYKCSVRDCDKTYYKASHLKSHMRRHSGVKPFACDWDGCKWRFSRSDELARHKRSHSGVKPYSCDLCDKAFSRSDHLSKHAKVHMKKLALYGTPIITKKCNYKYLTYNRISLDSL